MHFSTAFPTLSRNDRRLIVRDPFLVLLSGYVLFMAVLLRIGLPWVTRVLMAEFGFDLTPYYPLVAGELVLFPQFIGLVFGFLLLDERDHHTLEAMLVTSLPLRTFLLYRMTAAALLAFVMAVVTLLIVNPSGLSAVEILLVSAGGSVFSAAVMLFIAAYAASKVEGFALSKIYGLIGFLPLVAWFVPEPWQFLFGFFPPYWISKAVWTVAEGGSLWPAYLALGVVTALVYVWWLGKRFRVAAYR
jgi:fluoroquinolone transport system permease protein